MLNLKIPFYEGGRIAFIKEDKNRFIVARYGIDGKVKNTFSISKKEKNTNDLFNNYCDDLQGYLDYNKFLYNDSSRNNFNSIGYMKNYKKIKYIFALGALMPIVGVAIESGTLTFLGLALELLFVPAFVYFDKKSKFYEDERRKNKFSKEYINYLNTLENYTKNKEKKINPTKYSKVEKVIKNKEEKIIHLKKEKKNNIA